MLGSQGTSALLGHVSPRGVSSRPRRVKLLGSRCLLTLFLRSLLRSFLRAPYRQCATQYFLPGRCADIGSAPIYTRCQGDVPIEAILTKYLLPIYRYADIADAEICFLFRRYADIGTAAICTKFDVPIYAILAKYLLPICRFADIGNVAFCLNHSTDPLMSVMWHSVQYAMSMCRYADNGNTAICIIYRADMMYPQLWNSIIFALSMCRYR